MPSFQDSAVIFFLALLLFGPKKLPELARQLGKLMGEFRRASNEFRLQMEDELRTSEQEERQKQIAAIAAAAPVTPGTTDTPAVTENTIAAPVPVAGTPASFPSPAATPEPQPIASAGDLHLMPPSTGLPVARSVASTDLQPAFSSIPVIPAVDEDHTPPPPDRYHHLAPPVDAHDPLAPAETTRHG